jgi:hypothetical protein
MRRLPKRSASATIIGLSAALAFAALASVGSAVSPTSPSAGVAQYPNKVTICHRTKSKKNPYVTIRVSRNAVPAHLRHGDGIGPCPTASFTVCHKAKNGKQKTLKVRGAKAHRKVLKRGDRSAPARPRSRSRRAKAKRRRRTAKAKRRRRRASSKGGGGTAPPPHIRANEGRS